MSDVIHSVGVLIFRNNNQEVLLVEEGEKTAHVTGTYGIPSGRLDEGETEKEAAVRELEEESGLKTTQENLKEYPGNFYVADFERKGEGVKRISIRVFLCDKYEGEIKSAEDTTPKWIPVKEVDNYNLLANVKKMIRDALKYLDEVSNRL